jgi:anti-sigma-K factor RskA
MITAHHEELATLHAIGLLEGAERIAFERELADDTALQSMVRSLSETTALLALAAPSVNPPAALRASVLEAAEQPGPGAGARPGGITSFIRWLPFAAAAGFAVAAFWLASRNSQLQRDNADLRQRSELAERAERAAGTAQDQLKAQTLHAESLIRDLRQQLGEQRDLSQLKITALAALAGNTPEARAIAVWDPAQKTGLLTVERLPAISDEQDYQIWVVDPAYPNPVDGGVFKPGADGRAVLTFKGNQSVGSVAAFAISLEKKGGVPKAEGPIVLLGKF